MSSDNLLEKVKKLREITGVGFKDCKIAIDETGGDIDKSIDLLRKKGVSKANKRSERIAAEGLISIYEKDNKFSMVEVNSETDFVAKNSDFIKFVEEVSEVSFLKEGKIEDILISKMKNQKDVKSNLIDLISKIGEKITLRRCCYIDSKNSLNFSYTHSAIKKNIGKLGVLLSIQSTKSNDEILAIGKQVSMQVAATAPLSIDVEGLDKNILEKEKELIMGELQNAGKDPKIVEKIALGKLNKFISDNTLLNQESIMDPKKKVKDILKEAGGENKIEIKQFIRFKVGEGI